LNYAAAFGAFGRCAGSPEGIQPVRSPELQEDEGAQVDLFVRQIDHAARYRQAYLRTQRLSCRSQSRQVRI